MAMRASRLSEDAVERESLKYLPALIFQTYAADTTPVSSQDFVLTALAQLGALRLKASRCLISLFDRSHQYILAEATPTLSLQSDDVHDRGDRLWFGTTALPRHSAPCSVLVEERVKAYMEGVVHPDAVSVVPDLRAEQGFHDGPFSSQTPEPRFYAGVPLQSPRGGIIGSYCVLDDKPREGLDPTHMQFLQDMATTVMSHLVLSKMREEYRQGERMIRGIGSFVEGKSTLRNWRTTTGNDEISHEPSRTHYGGEGQLDSRQQRRQNQQTSQNYFPDMREDAHGHRDISGDDPIEGLWGPASSSLMDSTGTSEHSAKEPHDHSLAAAIRSPALRSAVNTFPTDSPFVTPIPTPNLPPSSHDTRSAPPQTLPYAFARAANIIRESLEVEGAIFYNSGASSYDHVHRDLPDSGASETASLDDASHSSSTDYGHDHSVGSPKHGGHCSVIAYSNSKSSSINKESASKVLSQLPSKFLKSLLRRFPQGKIFHFDANGTLSSGSSGDESGTQLTGSSRAQSHAGAENSSKSRRKKSKAVRPEDGLLLLKQFPGARSIGFFPLWDANHEKWHAGGFIYTMQPNRSFTVEGQLSFLNAIGSTIMTEVSRLEALTSDRSKTDLLGSISHELRSPLHGILGSVELLEGSPQTEFQSDMVHSIETCGRTLLDTMEQLLDFSKINHLAQQKKQMMYRASGPASRARLGDPATRLDVSIEEVITAVAAGHDAQTRSSEKFGNRDLEAAGHHGTVRSQSNRQGPSVILNVDKSMDAAFHIFPGAWRRIVMNLFANSLKYTAAGHIKVSLSGKAVRRQQSELCYKIYLTVVDTGQGISPDFLRDRLYKPFSQEDSLASGTGLGLSIVKQIVDAHHGRIQIDSAQGVGTRITVSLRLEREKAPSPSNEPDSIIHQTLAIAQRTQNRVACLLNHEGSSRTHSITDAIKLDTTLIKMCKDWFGLRFCSEADLATKHCDVLFVIEPDDGQPELDLNQLHTRIPAPRLSTGKGLLFVICRSLESRKRFTASAGRTLTKSWIVQCIAQPFGPQSLARSLARGLDLQSASHHTDDTGQRQPSNNDSGDTKPIPYSPSAEDATAPTAHGAETARPSLTSDDSQPLSVSHPSTSPSASASPTNTDDDPLTDAGSTTAIHKPAGQDTIVAAQQKQQHQPSTSDPSDPTKPSPTPPASTFLLVDDNAINLKIFAAHLKRRSLPYVLASDGQEAVEKYASSPPSCRIILMDISMPVMDGLAATRAIRAIEKQRSLDPPARIIIVTGLASKDIQEETHRSGADAYLSKPVRLKDLDRVLGELGP